MQEGFAGLWRGTNASLALAVPTVSISQLGTVFVVGFFLGLFGALQIHNILLKFLFFN